MAGGQYQKPVSNGLIPCVSVGLCFTTERVRPRDSATGVSSSPVEKA